MADRSSSKLAGKLQAAFGTAESTALTYLPFVSHTLGRSEQQKIESRTIKSGRFPGESRPGTFSAGGNIVVEMAHSDYTELLQNAFWNTFTVDTPIAGTDRLIQAETRRYFTIEDRQEDIGAYTVFQDMMVDTFQLDLAASSVVQGTFGMVGTNVTTSTTATTSPVAAIGAPPFDTMTGSLTLNAASFCVTELSIQINNRLDPRFCLYDQASNRIVADTVQVTGNMTISYDDTTYISAFLNNSILANLVFDMTVSGGSGHKWTIPQLKATGYQNPVTEDAERTQQIEFEAIFDSGTSTMIHIEETVV